MLFCIDFDGTIAEHEYPFIGKPNYKMIYKCIKLQKQGHKMILWTCRDGKELQEAVDFCAEQGLLFDAVNENYNPSAKFNPKKVFAHYYVDDRNISINDFTEGEFNT